MKKTIITAILIISSLTTYAYFESSTPKSEESILENLASTLTNSNEKSPSSNIDIKEKDIINAENNIDAENNTDQDNINQELGLEKEGKEDKEDQENLKTDLQKTIDDYSNRINSSEIKDILSDKLTSFSEKTEDSYTKVKEDATEKIKSQEEIIKNYIIDNSQDLSKSMRKEICNQLCETCD